MSKDTGIPTGSSAGTTDPSGVASVAGSSAAAHPSVASAAEHELQPSHILAEEDFARFQSALYKYKKASSPYHITPKELVLYSKVFEALTFARTDSSSSEPLEVREATAIRYLTQYIKEGVDLNEILYYPEGLSAKEIITPLTAAINYCSLKMTKFLLENRADVNFCTPQGVTSLHAAIGSKNPAKVALLLDYKAKPNITLNNGLTLIMTAIRSNLEEEVSIILNHPESKDNIDLSTGGNKGVNLVAMSLLFGNPSLATAIVSTGKADLTGFVELYSAVSNRLYFKSQFSVGSAATSSSLEDSTLNRLLKDAADKNYSFSVAVRKMEDFNPALLSAKQSLIYAKEALELCNSSNGPVKKAIWVCVKAMDEEECRDEANYYLSGICREKKYGSIAIDEAAIYAATIVRTSIVEEGDANEALLIKDLKRLLDAGLSPNHTLQKDSLIGRELLKESCTLFSYISMFGSPAVVGYLADRGASLESKSDDTLATPIHYAVNGNNLKIVQKLVSLGADVNTLTQNKATPLLISILRDFNEIALHLISLERTDVNHASFGIFNALNLALLYDSRPLIDALLQRSDLSFEMLPKLFAYLASDKIGEAKLKSLDLHDIYIQNRDIAISRSPENTLEAIIKRFKVFDIPEDSSVKKHLDFARAISSISPKKAAKHIEKVSEQSRDERPENLNQALEATKALVEFYMKNSVTEGYKKLYETVQRVKAQELAKFGERGSNEFYDPKLHLLKAIVDFEASSGTLLGIAHNEVTSQRDKLAAAKINKSLGIPDKKIVEECQKVLSVLRFLPESDLTSLEKQILKITNPEKIEALQKAAKLTGENGKYFKQVEANKAKIMEYLAQLNELFKIISAGLTKEEVQSLEKYCNVSISDSIIKNSISLQKTSIDVSSLEAFNMFRIKALVKAPIPDLASAAPSKPVARPAIEEKGGAAAGVPSAKKHEHAPEIEINLKTLEKFAKVFDPSSKVEFCEKVKEAIGYEPKPKGAPRDKYAKNLKAVLEKEYLDGSNPFGAIKQTFKLVLDKEVPGHFIMAFLHASTDETLESLYDEVVAVDEKRSQITDLTEASTKAKRAAPVDGLKKAAPVDGLKKEGLGVVSEHHEEDDAGKLKLSKPSLLTLRFLFEKNYSEITEAGLKRLLKDLEVKSYSYEEKKGKYVIKLPNGETIGGHDSHAENVRAGKEDGAIMAKASFKALRKSLVENDIIDDPFGEDSGEDLPDDLGLTEEQVASLVADRVADLQAADTDAREEAAFAQAPASELGNLIQAQKAMDLLEGIRNGIASGNPMKAEIKKLPEAFMILGLERHNRLFKDIDNDTVNMVGLWQLLIGRLDRLNAVPPEITEARIREGEPTLLALWSSEEHDGAAVEVPLAGASTDHCGGAGVSGSEGFE